MKKEKLLVVGNNAALIVCDDVQLDVLGMSKDRKTVVLGDRKTGTLYSNNEKAARAFIKKDVEAGEFAAMMLNSLVECVGITEITDAEIMFPEIEK